jgi:DNA polymerase I-like protein with 3'-5' exonuclease and polymerase domains
MNEALLSGLPVIMTDVSPNNTILPPEWLVEATKGIAEAGIDAKLVAFVHDETQWEVDVAHAQQAVEIIEAAATKAGEMLQFRCPVNAEGKIGNNWKQTH